MNCQDNHLFSPQLPCIYQSVSYTLASFNDKSSFKKFNINFPKQLHNAAFKRKAEYLAGRVCASKALTALGIENFQVRIQPNRTPLWPEGVCGSISHTAEIAVAITSAAPHIIGLGVDVEHSMSAQQEIALQDYIIYPNESAIFKAMSKHLANPLTLVFSAKESIFKALYPAVRTFFGFEAAELIDFNQNSFLFRLTKSLNESISINTQLRVYFQQNQSIVLTECALFE